VLAFLLSAIEEYSEAPDIPEGSGAVRQLGDVHRDPPRLVLAEQLGCRAADCRDDVPIE
jgi:hypothetical protein